MSQSYIQIWDRIADYWDSKTAAGNQFYHEMIEPFSLHQLCKKPPCKVLEVGCSSGLFAAKIADLKYRVTATDVSQRFIEIARSRWTQSPFLNFAKLDILNKEQVQPFAQSFELVVSNMVLMDLPDVKAFFQNTFFALEDAGRLIITTSHPAFNTSVNRFILNSKASAENGEAIKEMAISRYRDAFEGMQIGMIGQPEPHKIYHRSLNDILAPAFETGYSIVDLQELYLRKKADSEELSWQNFEQFPPVIGLVFQKNRIP